MSTYRGQECPRYTSLSIPGDLFKNGAEVAAFGWVDHLDKRYFAFEVEAEVGVGFAVLALRTMTHAIGQDGFEAVEIWPGDVDSLVGDHAG